MNAATARPSRGLLPGLLRICMRHAHAAAAARPAPEAYHMPKGHGENIWIFAHRRTEQVIFSFKDKLDGFHDLKQLPFNGKKTKPSKLRKDYWSPMALIEFPAGMGNVGRSAFQKLRELKHLHEVAWPDELRFKPESEYTGADRRKIAEEQAKGYIYRPVRSKKDRGNALNAQKKNVIADLAVVLAGQGGGNKVAKGDNQLVDVTVKWSNDQDMFFAEAWSHNVKHALLETPAYISGHVPQEEAPIPATDATAPPPETAATE